jgi:dCMP deaminase
MNKWDKRFMDMAKMVSTWSKDRSTGVGAVIVNDEKKIISVGYNGFPRGINDDIDSRHESPEKHHWTLHAERNAILEANVSLKDKTLYCTFFTCSNCAQAVTAKGFKRVVAPEPDWDHPRYGAGQKIAIEMYKEKGIEVEFYKEDDDVNLWVFYNIGCGGGKIHSIVSADKFKQYVDYHLDKLNEEGREISGYEIDFELKVIKFSGLEERHYLYFRNHGVDDFIYTRD